MTAASGSNSGCNCGLIRWKSGDGSRRAEPFGEGVTHRFMPTNARLLPDGRGIGLLLSHFVYPHGGEEQVDRGATAEDQTGRDYPFPCFILIRESRHVQGSVGDECDI